MSTKGSGLAPHRLYLRMEAGQLLRLAIPVVISQVGAMMMGIVDTIVVGRYSSIELAGVAAGNSVFWTIVVVGLGLLNAMDPIVANAHGANRPEDAHRCLGTALQFAVVFSLLMTPVLIAFAYFLHLIGADPTVVSAARPFLLTLSGSLLPLLFYGALQKYWQGFAIVLPFTLFILLANLLNWGCNVLFVNGGWGIPPLGAVGSAIATLACRLVTLAAALILTVRLWKKQGISDRPWHFLVSITMRIDRDMIRRLFRLGVPSALQILLEVWAFSFTTLIVTRLGAEILATHHIVLSIASFAFMFPMGLSAAIATRVGFHDGRGDGKTAHQSGWLGIAFAFLFMLFSALVIFIVPESLLRIFSDDRKVIDLALTITGLVVLFQVFDGVQVAAAGALRGLGDTKTAFFTNLLAHYAIGLPVGLSLCFLLNWGLYGLWIGLALGLAFTAVLNSYFWHRKRPLALAA